MRGPGGRPGSPRPARDTVEFSAGLLVGALVGLALVTPLARAASGERYLPGLGRPDRPSLLRTAAERLGRLRDHH